MALLRAFLLTAAGAARRQVTIAPPGWQELTAGEQQVLDLINAAQCNDEARLDAQVVWIARLSAPAMIRRAALALAATLNEHGLRVALTSQVETGEARVDRLMSA